MTTYVFTVSIGPVQDFIATARRSRDLWFGSWLLSELSKAAAERIVRLHGQDSLIFPAPADPGDLQPGSQFNVVNKIVALIDDPEATASEVGQAVGARLGEITKLAFDGVEGRDGGHFIREVAELQVSDMVEYFWAAYPIDDPSDPKQYREARGRAESLIAARKSTRDFKAVAWGAPVPKSSLDGQRESVIREEAYDRLSPRELRRVYGVRPGERLCGVGVLKRHGNRGDDSFFSTSHVAALPLLERLGNSEGARGAAESYVGRLRESLRLDDRELGRVPAAPPYAPNPNFSRRLGGAVYGYDGHLLFEERLADLVGERSRAQQERADLTAARAALGDFLRTALDGLRPLPYYGLLLADGDRMGAAIDAMGTPDEHRGLSKRLTAFARQVAPLVAGLGGSLVYAGGDDVLAFVPLHTALRCARDLADEFSRHLGGMAGGERPTLSVGLVVAHHLDPLSDSLALARSAERRAKAVPGKDALAVTVSKRSGSDTTVSGHWGELDGRLGLFTALHLADAVPDGAAYELRGLALRLGEEGETDGGLDSAAREEAVRVLRRKHAAHGAEDLAEEVLSELEAMIRGRVVSVGALSDELRVARVFADALAQAGVSPGEARSRLPVPAAAEGRR
jgi:CRISPR-associated protein Cmr2